MNMAGFVPAFLHKYQSTSINHPERIPTSYQTENGLKRLYWSPYLLFYR